MTTLPVWILLLSLPLAAMSQDIGPDILQAAEEGDPTAQMVVGRRTADPATSLDWLMRAAAQGQSHAMWLIATDYAESGRMNALDREEALRWFRLAAEHGSQLACRDLARLANSPEEAAEWERKERANADRAARENLEEIGYYAQQGYPEYQNALGYCYHQGQGTALDHGKAMEWYRKAANQGYPDAMNNIGTLYALGEGVSKNASEAERWWRKAAGLGSKAAQGNLRQLQPGGRGGGQAVSSCKPRYGWARSTGRVVPVDLPRPLREVRATSPPDKGFQLTVVPSGSHSAEIEALAMERDISWGEAQKAQRDVDGLEKQPPSAARSVAIAKAKGQLAAKQTTTQLLDEQLAGLLRGSGAGKEASEAQSAESLPAPRQLPPGAAPVLGEKAVQGDAAAQVQLGEMLLFGRGVPADYPAALEWFRRAAEQDFPDGQYFLGWMYHNGWGSGVNHAEAVGWYRLAAEKGQAQAQNNLGWMYQHGLGVAQDHREALRWYSASAEQGNGDGQNNLGWMFQQGLGTGQDYLQALRWYRTSADQGNPSGQCNLGAMYQNGWGVNRDYAEAAEWYRKSAEAGQRDGQFNLAWMYDQGLGVQADRDEALQWYSRAANQGHVAAAAAIKRLSGDDDQLTTR